MNSPQHIYNKTNESGLYGTFVKLSKNTRRRRRKAHDQLQYKLDDDLWIGSIALVVVVVGATKESREEPSLNAVAA